MAREPLSVQHQRIWGFDAAPLVLTARHTAAWPKETGWRVYTMYETSELVRVPLYVGYTHHLHARLGQHRRNQEWWPIVGAIVVESYLTQSTAQDAEHDRIRIMRPLFNIAGNQHTPSRLEEAL